MTTFFQNSNLRRWTARLVTAATVFAPFALVMGAGAPQTGPLFQYATLTGSGNTLTATNVPVVLSGGTTVYQNLTIQFNSDVNGNLSIAAGYPQSTLAPALMTSSFQAGTYVARSLSSSALIVVNGPGVTDGGATEWTSSLAPNVSGEVYPTSVNWYVGPLASNPLASRINKAGITSTAWSYGVGGGGSCGVNWCNDSLIGVSQVGNSITFVSFSTSGSTDHNVPVDQITYTLSQ